MHVVESLDDVQVIKNVVHTAKTFSEIILHALKKKTTNICKSSHSAYGKFLKSTRDTIHSEMRQIMQPGL